MSILVVDIGTSGLRAGVVRNDGSLNFLNYEACRPSTPAPGLVEFDAQQMADAVLRVCNQTIEQSKLTDTIDAVGITNQRASTVIWSKSTGKPFGQAIGWQDLRTVGECMAAAAEHGIKLAPNQTATKAAWMLQNYIFANKIDLADAVPARIRSAFPQHPVVAVSGLEGRNVESLYETMLECFG